MFVADDDKALAEPKTVIGLMSGTSVDAVDACCVRLSMKDGKLHHEILGNHTQAIPPNIKKRLLTCINGDAVSLKEISSLNTAVAQSFVDAAYGVMNVTGIRPEKIDLIASHGQTVFHQPPVAEGIIGNTLQIGEPSVIAEFTGIRTVGDFRPRDMALGGQGAPLVPFADKLLFQEDEKITRCIQNIGGMANVTVLPPSGSEQDIIAFDTGPGNMLIDNVMDILYEKSLDENGQTAADGEVIGPLLDELMGNEYLAYEPPKSTGRELFGRKLAERCVEQYADHPQQNIVTTVTKFTALSIADAYARFVFPHYEVQEVIAGGGGVKNPVLMQWLGEELGRKKPGLALKTHADFDIPNQYKEALAFAILGWATMAGMPNSIPTCTGARAAAVLGKIIV